MFGAGGFEQGSVCSQAGRSLPEYLRTLELISKSGGLLAGDGRAST